MITPKPVRKLAKSMKLDLRKQSRSASKPKGIKGKEEIKMVGKKAMNKSHKEDAKIRIENKKKHSGKSERTY